MQEVRRQLSPLNEVSTMNSTSLKRSFLSMSGAVTMLLRTWLCVMMVLAISAGTSAHDGSTEHAGPNTSNSVVDHDLMAITVTCPPEINVYATVGDCSAFVTISAPTVLGFIGAYILTNDFNGTADASDTYPVGVTTVNFTAEDGNAHETCSMTVTVKDNTDPTITCPADIIVGNDAGICGAAVSYAAPVGADNCSGATTVMTSVGTASGSTFPVGTTTISYETTDAIGLTANCSFTVTVNDMEAPLTLCQDVTVQLDASGNASVTAAQVNNGSTDNCGIDLVTLDVTDFTCANVGANTVTLSVQDASGNISTCTATVTVEDNIVPLLTCPGNISVNNEPGMCDAVVNYATPVGTDNCDQPVTTMVSFETGSGATFPVGVTPVFYRVEDVNGNFTECFFDVTVLDSEAPTITCPADITVDNDPGACGAEVFYTEPEGLDNCVFALTALATPLGSGDFFPIGTTTMTYDVLDADGNLASCSFIITVIDTEDPVITCPADIITGNDAGICGAIVNYAVPIGTDNCFGTMMTMTTTGTASGSTFPMGVTTVTYEVIDLNGNIASCSFTVTVKDREDPLAICQTASSNLDANGWAVLTPDMLNNGSLDNCAITSMIVEPDSFNSVGYQDVWLIVFDEAGNSDTCLVQCEVIDDTPPNAVCQDITLYLNSSGTASILPAELDGGSTDNGMITDFSVGQLTFDCGDLGATNDTLFVMDSGGNTSFCIATVTVIDTIPPVASCRNITVQLDANGIATIAAADIDNGSNDACGISSMAVDVTTFDCNSKGPHTVTLTVTDNSGNESTCQSIVTVEDTIGPIAVCQNMNTYLNASGNASINAIDLNNGSMDACGGLIFSASQTNFNCATIGPNDVILTVTDINGNSTTCEIIVTVLDTIRPNAICQNVTYTLPNVQNAQITITPTQLNNGSADNCTGSTFAISQSVFQHVGTFQDTLFVTDASGNVSFCVSSVTINDFTTPVAVCSAADVYLNTSGTATITTQDLDGGSTDNGTIASMTASQYIFNCSHQGPNNVTLIVTDEANNSSFCTTVVTVIDTIAPTAVCQNITVNKDPVTGIASITGAQIGGQSTDNCGTGGLTLSIDIDTFSNGGQHAVTLTVTDGSGNTSTCEAIVTVVDNTAPVANCKPATVYVDEFGIASITGNDIDNGSFDNEGIVAYSATPNVFNCGNLGTNTTVLTVTDQSGNTDDCVAVVTVLDTIAPTVICQNVTVALNSQGVATISSTDINNGTFDNCSNATLTYWISANTFTDIGQYTVVLTATDPSGNSASCEGIVTVGDDLPPVVLCQPTTTYLDLNGNATITADDIDGGSYDNGVLEGLVAGQTVFNCSDLGSNQITLTGMDDRGNSATCIALVTVLDTIAPVAMCQNITVVMDFFGNATLDGIEMDGGSTDNCGSGSLQYTSSLTSFTEEGTFEVVLAVADAGGNISSCTAQVTVEQPVKPLVIPAGFSPNADGIADTWEIQGLREFPNNNVMIFNRWGTKLFSAAPYENDWYGQVNVGSLPGDLSAGTYFYILELGDGGTRTGYIQLNK